MIFTVAFDYSPLDRVQKKQVLDIVTKELLTPKGLRTLSPKSGEYNPNYVGPQIQRDYAYHQGTAWPWLMGFYMEAYLRIYKMSGISFVERQLIGLEDEMTSHCVGSLPELFDGNPPFKGRGAVSFAMIYRRRDEDESFNVWMGVPPAYLRRFRNCQLWFDKRYVSTRGYGDYILYSQALG